MKHVQPSLFDCGAADDGPRMHDPAYAAKLRITLRARIEDLRAMTAPPWKEEIDAILEVGSVKRSLRCLPRQERDALWAEFDVEAWRPWEIWLDEHMPWTDEEIAIAIERGLLPSETPAAP